jgi:hypothetical protein
VVSWKNRCQQATLFVFLCFFCTKTKQEAGARGSGARGGSAAHVRGGARSSGAWKRSSLLCTVYELPIHISQSGNHQCSNHAPTCCLLSQYWFYSPEMLSSKEDEQKRQSNELRTERRHPAEQLHTQRPVLEDGESGTAGERVGRRDQEKWSGDRWERLLGISATRPAASRSNLGCRPAGSTATSPVSHTDGEVIRKKRTRMHHSH